jgi:TPR repeat protein
MASLGRDEVNAQAIDFLRSKCDAIDLMEGTRYFKCAANQGYADAQHSYAVCLQKGEAVLKDEAEDLKYLQLASDHGHPAGQHGYWLSVRSCQFFDQSDVLV